MSKPSLGRLERVAPRTYWENEALDFTPWLASEENIALLSEAIGFDLEVQQQEARVGPFRADILCRDTLTDHLVLIENQLERTDHTHLGQLFTYAAGLDAVTVVWIAERFTEEHRAALDWLNRITHEDFRFFGIEVELWKIGDSIPAPKFNLVAKPNDWSKSVREAASTQRGELTDAQELQVAYWREFDEVAAERGSRYRLSKPVARTHIDFGIGRTGFSLGAAVRMYRNEDAGALVYLYIGGDESSDYFKELRRDEEAIERELGFSPLWDERPDFKNSQVSLARQCDPSDPAIWPELHAWMHETMEAFERVLRPRVRGLRLAEQPGDDILPEA